MGYCGLTVAEYHRNYYRKNIRKIKAYRLANARRIKTYNQQYKAGHKDESRLYGQVWRSKHPEHLLKSAEWAKSNRTRRNATAAQLFVDRPGLKSFYCARQRCNDPKNNMYKYYGRRGIKFNYKSPAEFFADVGFRPSSKHSIDRINGNGNYEIGNCRWATAIEQRRNRV